MSLDRPRLAHNCPVARALLARPCPLRTSTPRGPTLLIRLQGLARLQLMARPSPRNWRLRCMIHPWRVDHQVEVSTRSHPSYKLWIDHTLQRFLVNPRTPAITTSPNLGLCQRARILANRTQSLVARHPYTQASHTRNLPGHTHLSPPSLPLREGLATLRRRTVPIPPPQAVPHPNRTTNYSCRREAGLRVSCLVSLAVI